MKNIHIVTHGAKCPGEDPRLTLEGLQEVNLIVLPSGISQIICGTGRRFEDTLNSLVGVHGIPVKYSPLCGSADSGERAETGFQVILASGTKVPVGDYIGLIGTPGVDLKTWIQSLPENTLLVAGRELTGALGYRDGQPGRLYRCDGETVTPME